MTVFADISEVINRLTGGNAAVKETASWWKDTSALTVAAGTLTSMWCVKGQPGAAPTPSTVAIPTNATPGALRHTNPSGGLQRWLRSANAHAWVGSQIIIYDRLLHCGGLSGTSTSAQTVGTDITRYTGQSSLGNIIIAEVYATIGSSLRTVSCNYLDKDGTTRASGSVIFGGGNARQAGMAVVIPFNTTAGANSVTRVVDTTLSASTGSAGNWGITIARPLIELSVTAVDSAGFGTATRKLALTDIELLTNACLGILVVPSVAILNSVRGAITSVER